MSWFMWTLWTQWKELGARHLLPLILAALFIMQAVFFGLVINGQFKPKQEGVLKISEIRGPRIDEEAAMTGERPDCFTLPVRAWVFLVITYVALIVFNFAYTFPEVTKPQWFWEMLYSLFFIAGWFVWDGCRVNIWFPFAIAEFGFSVFALYVYFVEKKMKMALT